MNSSDRHQGRTATEAGWHISRYNIAARIPGTKMTVIFNTYRRICAVYTPIELHIMRVLDEVSENHPLIGRLASRGVIANYDEREAFALQRTLSCAHAPVGGVSITICPTLACNFECPYCFATRGRGKMTPEVQDDVVAFAARMLDAANAKELTITWFGGEPLMATDVIEALSPRLIEVAEERGCKYEAWVFTNGHLLSQSVVDLLLRCRVTYVHIPLDGVGATNDATRRLVGGRANLPAHRRQSWVAQASNQDAHAKELEGHFANLRIVCQQHEYAGAARNRGVDLASGEYVLFPRPSR